MNDTKKLATLLLWLAYGDWMEQIIDIINNKNNITTEIYHMHITIKDNKYIQFDIDEDNSITASVMDDLKYLCKKYNLKWDINVADDSSCQYFDVDDLDKVDLKNVIKQIEIDNLDRIEEELRLC